MTYCQDKANGVFLGEGMNLQSHSRVHMEPTMRPNLHPSVINCSPWDDHSAQKRIFGNQPWQVLGNGDTWPPLPRPTCVYNEIGSVCHPPPQRTSWGDWVRNTAFSVVMTLKVRQSFLWTRLKLIQCGWMKPLKQTNKTLVKKIAHALLDSDAHSWKSLELGDLHTKSVMRVSQFQHT